MIIYGNKATKTGHQSLFNSKCSHCGTKGSLEMYTFSRYFHIFWIPVFPYRKEAVTQCNHCKQVLKKKEFSADLLSDYEEMKVNTKTPYWQFIGLLLFIFLIIAVVNSIREDNKRDIAYLTTPKTGDIYEIYTVGEGYTLYKVSDVKTDSVYVIFNKYQSNKKSGLNQSKMTEAGSFIEEEYLPIAKKDLLKMKDKGEIEGVRRR
ncbi:zinc-ribbon domain-containing protein [Ferruginibacter sp. SUN106]|uniref:zinc-ribbon domain-containing protein n=1 Tax=Ferruginibacter sp. SUN106 TaxID=2978348 RepID=UPI003D36D0A0